MKLRCIERPDYTRLTPLKIHKFDAPFVVSPANNHNSQKQSRQTPLTERSSSKNKVMIPHSQKLAHFFNNSRPLSSQKSFSTSSTDCQINQQKLNYQNSGGKSKKIEFLKFNINRDYFDEKAEQNIKQNLQKNTFNSAKTRQKLTSFKQRKFLMDRKLDSRQNSYKSATLIKCQKPLYPPLVKFPSNTTISNKIFVKSTQTKMPGKQRQKRQTRNMQANQLTSYRSVGKKQFQYTFGLN